MANYCEDPMLTDERETVMQIDEEIHIRMMKDIVLEQTKEFLKNLENHIATHPTFATFRMKKADATFGSKEVEELAPVAENCDKKVELGQGNVSDVSGRKMKKCRKKKNGSQKRIRRNMALAQAAINQDH